MAKYINVDALGIGPCNAAFFADVNYAKGWNAVIKILDNMPAADVRPVVRGEWIKNEFNAGWHCSVCKTDDYYAYSWNSETGENEFQDNFCPNCGADMRGKNNDNL